MKVVAVLLTAVAAFSGASVGAQQTQTYMTTAYPISRGGKPVGCAIEFNAGVADYIYRQGSASIVKGSLNFYGYREGQVAPYIGGKLHIEDLRPDGKTFVPNAPAQFALFGKDGKPMKRISDFMDGDMLGSKLASFAFDDGFGQLVKSITEDNHLQITFNRVVDGTDVRLPVDLLVGKDGEREKTSETALVFLNCVTLLGRELQKQLPN